MKVLRKPEKQTVPSGMSGHVYPVKDDENRAVVC